MKNQKFNDAQVFIGPTITLFIGQVLDNDIHRHHLLQLTVAIEDNFNLLLDGVWTKSNGIIIKPDFNHQLNGSGSSQILLLIDPESDEGIHIMKSHLKGDPYIHIDMEPLRKIIINSLKSIKEKTIPLEVIINKILLTLGTETKDYSKIDSRIVKTINLIKNLEDKKILIKDLAKEASLSESRIQHLFKDEIGISIKRYLLWRRLIDAISLIRKYSDLTTAAHGAGFSDSAHMSRTFRDSFGLNLSEIFKNSRSIQVNFSKDL